MQLLEPLELGPHRAPNRVMFGPHVTNLGDGDRRLTHRHTAYYERRARGGCGTIVVEGASVHDSDHPYERAPLATRCGPGWAEIVEACSPHGTLVVASLDHAGGQGSSAYHQRALWAPSRVPEVNTREVPKWMEDGDIHEVISAFGDAARLAVDAGCHGVEINIGQHSLVRQFLSGLTNQRTDHWGEDRLRFAREVIAGVRAVVPSATAVVGIRLCVDELAPWAGITPEMAPAIAAELVDAGADYLVAVRGSIFSADKTRPDFHEPTGFNVDAARAIAAVVPIPVVLQGSVVDVGQAEWAVGGHGEAAAVAAVEMTRALIADPDLVSKLVDGVPEQIRPCTRCNQTCQVRDARNPIVTCVGEPTSGRETEDPDWYRPADTARDVVVIGGGPAGLETARVAAQRGHRVELREGSDRLGGVAAVAGPHRAIIDWLVAECTRLGVTTELSAPIGGSADLAQTVPGTVVVDCTGSTAGRPTYAAEASVIDVADLYRGSVMLPDNGPVVLIDPIGGPIAVALAEQLGERAILVTPDQIAGNELSRTGDLAPANTRLAQAGVRIERRAVVRAVTATPAGSDGTHSGPGGGTVAASDADGTAAASDGVGAVTVDVEDRFSGERRSIRCAAVVDCGFRLPAPSIEGAHLRAGDCVAPRTVHEAILEGRRAALAIDHVEHSSP